MCLLSVNAEETYFQDNISVLATTATIVTSHLVSITPLSFTTLTINLVEISGNPRNRIDIPVAGHILQQGV